MTDFAVVQIESFTGVAEVYSTLNPGSDPTKAKPILVTGGAIPASGEPMFIVQHFTDGARRLGFALSVIADQEGEE